MNVKLNGTLVAWLLISSTLFAQSGPAFVLPETKSSAAEVAQAAPATENAGPMRFWLRGGLVEEVSKPGETVVVESGPPPITTGPIRFWVRAEYLAWWIKNAPLPVSLLTTGDPLNSAGAELLNGNRDFGAFSGMRLSIGGWFDDANNIGVEGNFFFLGQRHNDYFTTSDQTGNPTLALPFFNQTPGKVGGNVLLVASPGQLAGNFLAASSFNLWSGELNADFCLYRIPGFEFTLLTGFRYLDMRETLNLSEVTSKLTVSPHSVTILSDNFNTRNQFYGGQLAGRFVWQSNAVSLNVTGKLGIGSTHQVVDIQGYTTQFGPGTINGSIPAGVFVQPSNSGRFTANQFGLLPSLELKLYSHWSPNFRIFVGYDVTYWNQVVRPGNQIDRNVNLSQSAVLGNTNGVLTGPAAPTPLFNRSDFWMQGITTGLEWRF